MTEGKGINLEQFCINNGINYRVFENCAATIMNKSELYKWLNRDDDAVFFFSSGRTEECSLFISTLMSVVTPLRCFDNLLLINKS